jgi:hypothetical protein
MFTRLGNPTSSDDAAQAPTILKVPPGGAINPGGLHGPACLRAIGHVAGGNRWVNGAAPPWLTLPNGCDRTTHGHVDNSTLRTERGPGPTDLALKVPIIGLLAQRGLDLRPAMSATCACFGHEINVARKLDAIDGCD